MERRAMIEARPDARSHGWWRKQARRPKRLGADVPWSQWGHQSGLTAESSIEPMATADGDQAQGYRVEVWAAGWAGPIRASDSQCAFVLRNMGLLRGVVPDESEPAKTTRVFWQRLNVDQS